MTTDGIRRRHALSGAVGLGLGLPVLAACGGDSGSPTDPGTEGGGTNGGEGGTTLGPTSDVPVGSGTIFDDQKVVVVQPTEGDFKAFSSICTHQGCPVSQVDGEEILCQCHGSVFSIVDGSVVDGPATAALDEVGITVKGDEITLT